MPMYEDDPGCPCTKTCCDDPDVIDIEHDCEAADDEFCDDCCGCACANCGGQCYCDV